MAGLPSGTVTFLFTDIQGSTRLAREHPETWDAVQVRHHVILRQAIESNRGYVFQIIGDAFCAAFHTAEEALHAAIKAQTDLHAAEWGDVPIKVRMGIHTGKAEIRENGEYQGYLAMSRVQRLMSAGHGGQVLISAASQELLQEDLPENVSLRDLGERRLKDLIRPAHIYQLVIPGLPVEFPSLKTLDFYPHNLPLQLTSFIGREKEMSEIKKSIQAHRLVTLTGTGGTGKTRLALQVAADMMDQFPDGVWFVDLTPVTDLDLIIQSVLIALGIPDQPGLTPQQQLLDFLQKKKLLLLLDNCEHLVQGCVRLVEMLLSHMPELTVLATSREALAVSGEVIWQVPSLSLPDTTQLTAVGQISQYEAVQLFIERATLAQPHFQVTNANAPDVAQICFHLDGIPLAIELAAARVRTMSIDQIARRLDDRFRLLTGGGRATLGRHQTLRAAIDWSYNLLSDQEKLLFARLSVFTGGWTLEAAEQICSGGDIDAINILDLLAHLVDKSLVILDETRYRMLETTRQYACEKCIGSEEGIVLRDRHLNYFLDLVEQASRQSHQQDKQLWEAHISQDDDNFRTALAWCLSEQNTEAALRLLVGWKPSRGLHFSETLSWFERIRSLPNLLDHPALYAKLLNHIGASHWLRGNNRDGRTVVEESLPIWQKLGADGESGLAFAYICLGEILLSSKDEIKAAQACFERSFKVYEKLGDKGGMSRAMYGLVHKDLLEENYMEAEEKLTKCLAIYKGLGDLLGMAAAISELGTIAQLQDNYERAYDLYEQSVQLFQEQHVSGILRPIFLFNSAWILIHIGDYQNARIRFEESLELYKEDGDTNGMIMCLAGFAGVLGARGKSEEAARLFGAFESLFGQSGARPLDVDDQKEVGYYLAMVREQLDEGAFAKAWTEGQEMTLEQAIAFALEKTSEEAA